MLHRRSTIPALLLALPLAGALTSCGFDYPTDRVTQYGAGMNDREASVDVLGARIVASGDGHGRLIGTLANNNPESASLVSVSASTIELTADVKGIRIQPGKRVNLSQDVEVPVAGEFSAGEFVELVYEFSTGERVDIDVPVVKQCFQYEEIEIPAAPSDDPSSSTGAEEEAGDEHATEGDATYLCAHETAHGGSEEGGH